MGPSQLVSFGWRPKTSITLHQLSFFLFFRLFSLFTTYGIESSDPSTRRSAIYLLLPAAWLEMFRYLGMYKFGVSLHYNDPNSAAWQNLEYGEGRCSHRYPRNIFINVFLAEHALRETVQRMEMMQHRIRSSHKVAYLESGVSKPGKWYLEYEMLQKKHYDQVRVLYEAESMLYTRPLKANYDRRRKNPKWYMQPELVQDCIDQGGCCSRACGCCAHRSRVTKGRGIGHCTTECRCCISLRGFELSEQEKNQVRDSMVSRLESEDVAYLLRMADAYFSVPSMLPDFPWVAFMYKIARSWWLRPQRKD